MRSQFTARDCLILVSGFFFIGFQTLFVFLKGTTTGLRFENVFDLVVITILPASIFCFYKLYKGKMWAKAIIIALLLISLFVHGGFNPMLVASYAASFVLVCLVGQKKSYIYEEQKCAS